MTMGMYFPDQLYRCSFTCRGFQYADFLGEAVLAPRRPHEYLTEEYGTTFMTPAKQGDYRQCYSHSMKFSPSPTEDHVPTQIGMRTNSRYFCPAPWPRCRVLSAVTAMLDQMTIALTLQAEPKGLRGMRACASLSKLYSSQAHSPWYAAIAVPANETQSWLAAAHALARVSTYVLEHKATDYFPPDSPTSNSYVATLRYSRASDVFLLILQLPEHIAWPLDSSKPFGLHTVSSHSALFPELVSLCRACEKCRFSQAPFVAGKLRSVAKKRCLLPLEGIFLTDCRHNVCFLRTWLTCVRCAVSSLSFLPGVRCVLPVAPQLDPLCRRSISGRFLGRLSCHAC
eukprot:m.447070 g.447070  ORF g.447070 m.447070 type:complete len:341 (+) comp56877_c0_seq3:472-1494(+)